MCKSARRGILNFIPLWISIAPGDRFKMQSISDLEADAAVAKHLSRLSLVPLILSTMLVSKTSRS
jgi:hypothetical protein